MLAMVLRVVGIRITLIFSLSFILLFLLLLFSPSFSGMSVNYFITGAKNKNSKQPKSARFRTKKDFS